MSQVTTLGDLIRALNGRGANADPLRPEGSSTSSYEGVDETGAPVTGTYDGIVRIDGDDVPDSVKEKVHTYLNKRTSGDGDLETGNYIPIPDGEGISKGSLTSAAGTPEPLADTKNLEFGYTVDLDQALKDAVNVFYEGHFFDAPSELIDKNSQVDGHTRVLETGEITDKIVEQFDTVHPKEIKATTIGGGSSRWSRGYYPPEGSFNKENKHGEDGVKMIGSVSPILGDKGISKDKQTRYTPDRPFISEDEMGETYLNRNPMLEAGNKNRQAPWRDIENWDKQWDSIKTKPGDYGEKWVTKYEYAANLASMLQEHNNRTPGFYFQSSQSFLLAIIAKVVFELLALAFGALFASAPGMPNVDDMLDPESKPPDQMEFGSSWKSKMDYQPPPAPAEPVGLFGAIAGAVGDALGIGAGKGDDFLEKTMLFLGLPMPKNTVAAISGNYDNIFFGIVAEFFRIIGDYVGADETMINFFSPIITHFMDLMADIEQYRMNRIDEAPLGVFNITLLPDMFLLMLKDSPIMRFLRAMMMVMEGYYAAGGPGGVSNFSLMNVNTTDESQNFYGEWSHHPATRGTRSRTIDFNENGVLDNKWFAAQSLQKLPSMYLLPQAYTAISNLDSHGTRVNNAPGLMANTKSSLYAYDRLKNHIAPKLGSDADKIDKATAIGAKVGTPINEANTRFSPEEVNQMENLLEAEHMPFYIQDCRTNEIIAFHAFLSSLSDSYSPSFKSSSGFGRIEDVQIYEKTSRAISITFTMAAMSRDDMDELYWKLNKLTTMVYPQWSEGTAMQTLLDGNPVTFRQPFSQIPTASPLVRLRIGDLIKNNYSKQNMVKQFGGHLPEFLDGTLKDFHVSGEDGMNKIIANYNAARKRVLSVPVDNPGAEGGLLELSDTKGWPIGSKVYVKLPDSVSGRTSYDEDKAENNQYKKTKGDKTKRFKKASFWCEIVQYFETSNRYGKRYNGTTDVLVQVAAIEGDPACPSPQPFTHKANAGQRALEDNKMGIIRYRDIVKTGEKLDKMIEINSSKLGLEQGIDALQESIASLVTSYDILFDATKNPYFQSFNSSMGRGLAGIINSLSFNYQLNNAPFEIDPGTRAPTMIEVSLGFTPIHDIAPGIDSTGGNRAPIYPVGSSRLGGDSWDTVVKAGGAETTNEGIETFDNVLAGKQLRPATSTEEQE